VGSAIEINDTLQLTWEQGFPAVLDIRTHRRKAYQASDFEGQAFEFRAKPGIRIYHAPPVRNFLVENRGGKWLYWGLIHIQKIRHDYVRGETAGTFTIEYLYSPAEMMQAHRLIDRNSQTEYTFDDSDDH
jgi:hypothetical protein